ncbi:MAG TPA: beta-N-acetylhexosaminidase [Stellaceae bacterium]
MSSPEPRAAIFGCSGATLTPAERDFFRDADPLGFILFQRNCHSPDQVRRLVSDLRDAVGRADAPVLIDQEGGRVARLKPPHWPAYPAPAAIAALGAAAKEAAWLGARLIADDLAALGITVDCVPVLDIPVPGADAVIGDRALGDDPAAIATLGRAVCDGMLAGGVLPVIKHIPGHGRATVDSHHALPRVDASRAILAKSDFAPFKALADMPWAMTAHIVYTHIDAGAAATLSRKVVTEVIRGEIGFDGVLVSDDLSMRALGGSFADRTQGALAAGCDLVLHCNGNMTEMTAVAGAAARLTPAARRRVERAEARRGAAQPIDRATLAARFDALMARAA